jgi:hypothetical protein
VLQAARGAHPTKIVVNNDTGTATVENFALSRTFAVS